MAGSGLTAAERETVIISSDAAKYWIVSTHQKSKLTQLEKMVANGNAKKLEDITFGSQAGGVYQIPLNMVTLRNPKPKDGMIRKSTRSTGRGRPTAAHCKGKTVAGNACKALAGPNGYCFKHGGNKKS